MSFMKKIYGEEEMLICHYCNKENTESNIYSLPIHTKEGINWDNICSDCLDANSHITEYEKRSLK